MIGIKAVKIIIGRFKHKARLRQITPKIMKIAENLGILVEFMALGIGRETSDDTRMNSPIVKELGAKRMRTVKTNSESETARIHCNKHLVSHLYMRDIP